MTSKKLKTFFNKSSVRMNVNRAVIASFAAAAIVGIAGITVHDEVNASTFSDIFTDEEEQEIAEQLEKNILLYVGDQVSDEEKEILSENIKIAVSEAMEANIKNEIITGYTDDQIDQLLASFRTDLKNNFPSLPNSEDLSDEDITNIVDTVLDSSLSQFESDIKQIKNNIDALKLSSKSLQSQVESLKEIDAESLKESEWNGLVQDIEGTLKSVDSSISSLNKALNVSTLDKDLFSIITGGDNNGYVIKNEIDVSNLSIAEYIDVLVGNDVTFESTINDMNDAIISLEQKASETIANNQESLNEVKENIDDHIQKTQTLQDALSDLNEKIMTETAARMSDCTNFSNKLTETVLLINEDFKDLSDAIESENAKVKQTVTKQLETDYDSLMQLMAQNYKNLTDEQKEYLSNITAQIKSFAAAMQISFQGTDEQLMTEIEKIEASISEIEQNFDDNDIVSAAQNDINDAKSVITMLLEQNSQSFTNEEATHYNELIGKISSLNTDLSSSYNKVKETFNSDINTIKKYCTDVKSYTSSKLADSDKRWTQEVNSINKLLSQIDEYSKAKDEAVYNEIVLNANQMQESISESLSEYVTAFNTTEQAHYNELVELLSNINKTAAKGAEQFNAELEDANSNLSQSISETKSLLTSSENNIDTMASDITELLNDNITEINSYLTSATESFNNQVLEMKEDIELAQANITSLSGRTSALEYNLQTLQNSLNGCVLSYKADNNFYVSNDSTSAKIGLKEVVLPISENSKITVTMQIVKHEGSDSFVYEFFDNDGSYSALNSKLFDEIVQSDFMPTRAGCIFGGYKNPNGDVVFSCDRDGNEYTYKGGELIEGEYTAIWYDCTKPIITGIDSVRVAQNKQILTVTATDTGFGIAGYYVGKTEPTEENISNGSITFDESSEESYSATITESGHYYIAVIDLDGNIATMETNYVIAE